MINSEGEISLVRKVISGESRIFNDIMALRDKNSGNYAGFKEALIKYLKKYNFNVIHNKTYHDYPSYNGLYSKSLATVSNKYEIFSKNY